MVMKTVEKKVTIRDLVDGFEPDTVEDEEVIGYHGALNIRPSYQRGFVYPEAKQIDVMESIIQGVPIGIMYWVDLGGGRFEVLDGQQRTISICRFIKNTDYLFDFDRSGKRQTFKNLKKSSPETADRILDYELLVYTCDGEEAELMKWFERINIAGLRLTPQEIRNAIYNGPFVTEMKSYFSTPDAGKTFGVYMNGKRNRQELLEKGIKWFIGEDGDVSKFMDINRENENNKADEIHERALDAIGWAHKVFGEGKHPSMKGVDWGGLYRDHGLGKNKRDLDCEHMASEAERLRSDHAVTDKQGIYLYLLSDPNDPTRARHLHVRLFDRQTKQAAFDKQGGKCANSDCSKGNVVMTIDEMDADHVTAWSKGGATDPKNCQVLCRDCNQRKGNA